MTPDTPAGPKLYAVPPSAPPALPEQLDRAELQLCIDVVGVARYSLPTSCVVTDRALKLLAAKLRRLIVSRPSLRRLELGRELREAEIEAERTGDFSRVYHLLREIETLARQRHGLPPPKESTR